MIMRQGHISNDKVLYLQRIKQNHAMELSQTDGQIYNDTKSCEQLHMYNSLCGTVNMYRVTSWGKWDLTIVLGLG